MKYFDIIPAPVIEQLENRGVVADDLLYCAKADLDGEGKYVDIYIAFTKKTLYTISGLEQFIDKSGLMNFEFTGFTEHNLSDIKNIYLDRHQNTARLVVEGVDGNEFAIARFSIGFSEKFEKFSQRVNATIKNEEIDDSSLESLELFCKKCGQIFPDPNRPICPKCVDRRSTFIRLCGMFKDFKKEILLIILTLFLGWGFQMVSPLFGAKMLYDDVLSPDGKLYGKLLFVVIILASIELFSILLRMFSGIVVGIVTPKVIHKLRCKIFESIQALSLEFFTGKQTASLMTRIDRDTGNVYWFFLSVIPMGIQSISKVIGITIIMFILNPWFALTIIGLLLFIHFVDSGFWRTQRKFFRKADVSYRNLYSVLSDALNGQRVVKSFAKENSENKRFKEQNKSVLKIESKINKRFSNILPPIWTFYRLISSILFCVGAWLVINDHMLFGSLAALIAYIDMLHEPINFFAWFGDRYAKCTDAASRMFEIMDSRPTVAESEDAVRVTDLTGDIELKNVSFEYEAGRPIIKNINIKVEHGQMFGLVGKTGAGKSTIINLIARLYDVTAGEILIGGVNIKNLAFEDLRRNVGIVSQETFLFIGTIADNIRYANPDASIEDVISAAKSSNAHEFILKLPNGYNTVVGDGGASLSGGERQRISIARAIIQKPNILILDEATASMDTRTERKIQAAIDVLKQGRTIISIAHRLSTLRDADMLCVIENGEVKEQGTHDELFKLKGKYYDLYVLQYEALKSVSMD